MRNSLDDYFALAQDIDYTIHYSRGQIVSFIELDEKTKQPMGEVAHSHERMVARIIALLANLLGFAHLIRDRVVQKMFRSLKIERSMFENRCFEH